MLSLMKNKSISNTLEPEETKILVITTYYYALVAQPVIKSSKYERSYEKYSLVDIHSFPTESWD